MKPHVVATTKHPHPHCSHALNPPSGGGPGSIYECFVDIFVKTFLAMLEAVFVIGSCLVGYCSISPISNVSEDELGELVISRRNMASSLPSFSMSRSDSSGRGGVVVTPDMAGSRSLRLQN